MDLCTTAGSGGLGWAGTEQQVQPPTAAFMLEVPKRTGKQPQIHFTTITHHQVLSLPSFHTSWHSLRTVTQIYCVPGGICTMLMKNEQLTRNQQRMSQGAPAPSADVGAHSSQQSTPTLPWCFSLHSQGFRGAGFAPAGPPQDPMAWHRAGGSHLTVLAHTWDLGEELLCSDSQRNHQGCTTDNSRTPSWHATVPIFNALRSWQWKKITRNHLINQNISYFWKTSFLTRKQIKNGNFHYLKFSLWHEENEVVQFPASLTQQFHLHHNFCKSWAALATPTLPFHQHHPTPPAME